jgi:predicted RNase H-like HicB family nuclease
LFFTLLLKLRPSIPSEFSDVSEAHAAGDTLEEATRTADEALELALTFYTYEWKDLPVASTRKHGMRMIRVPALSEAKCPGADPPWLGAQCIQHASG